ncbi:MAG: succinate dehydrogenase [Pseudomonadota bacterium]
MIGARLYLLQRTTALMMAPLVLGHIAVMIYAVQGGLSASEILGRTQGSAAWALFYGTFVLAVSIHAAIGVRAITYELTGLNASLLNGLTWAIFLGLGALGFYSVWAVTFGVAPL